MMQLSHPKTPVLKQPEAFVLVLDAALMVSEDQKLIEDLKKISQGRGAKILVVGIMSVQMQARLQDINIEMISLEDLKQNKNNYTKGKIDCFMGASCSPKDKIHLIDKYAACTTLAPGEKLINNNQWKSFCIKLSGQAAAPKKSVAMENRQSALLESGHGMFASAPAPAKAGAQAVRSLPSTSGMRAASPQISHSGTQVVRQRPAIPINIPSTVVYPHLYFTSKCLAAALGKSDCTDIDLPEISLSQDGCLSIKLKKEFVKDLKQNSLFQKNFKLDQSGNCIGKFENIDALINMFEPYGINFTQAGGYYLRVIPVSIEAVEGYLPEDRVHTWLIENNPETSALVRLCSETSMFHDNEISYYYYEFLEKRNYQIIMLDNRELDKLKLEESGLRKIYVSPEENSTIYNEVVSKKPYQVNVKGLYTDLSTKECRDFMAIWNKVKPEKYPESCKIRSLLCQKLSASEYNDIKKIDLSLDAEGNLQIKAHSDIYKKYILKDGYVKKIFELDEDGCGCVKFKNITALKEMLAYFPIEESALDLEKLYRELCDKDGYHFETVWENAKNTTIMQKFF